METTNKPVEPYMYFWLHVQPAERQSASFIGNWISSKNDEYNDGDHFIGRIREYCIGQNGDLLVILEPLWKVVSDDGPFKWHRVGKYPQSIMKFERCTITGEKGHSRIRFRNETELIILSSSEHDRALIEALVEEDEP